jgi:hypothetical protein
MTGKRHDGTLHEAVMASSHLQERREARYEVPFEIEVSGLDNRGAVFHERTITRNVSEWGCGFVLPVQLKADDMIAVRLCTRSAAEPAQLRQSVFQVRHVARNPDGWLIGAWKMDNNDLWGTDLETLGKPEGDKLASREDSTSQHQEQSRKDAHK